MAKKMDHAKYQAELKNKTIIQLAFIIRDAAEAIRAMPDGENAGFYADEVSYATMELNNRKGIPDVNRYAYFEGYKIVDSYVNDKGNRIFELAPDEDDGIGIYTLTSEPSGT